jgi:uncharacterized membrane protein
VEASEIIRLVTAFLDSAPWLVALVVLVALIGASVVVGNNSAAARRVRASIDKLRDSLERSRTIIAEAERANYEVAEQLKQSAELNGDAVTEAVRALDGVRDARAGITDALSIIRAIQDTNNSSGDSALD